MTFEYRRCPGGHGRLISFFNFLRQKDFIKPLSKALLDDSAPASAAPDVEAAFAAFEREPRWYDEASRGGLVNAAIGGFARWWVDR